METAEIKRYYNLLRGVCKYKEEENCNVVHSTCNFDNCELVQRFIFEIANEVTSKNPNT